MKRFVQALFAALTVDTCFIAAPSLLWAQAADSTTPRSANERMQVPGPEAEQLARRSGTWNVVITLRPTPDATPIVTSGLVAERTMVGLFLEEVIKPARVRARPTSAASPT